MPSSYRETSTIDDVTSIATPPDDLLALDRQVCFALAVAARRVIALYRPVLDAMDLTHPQYLVMLALWEQQPQRVSDLARRLSLEPPTLSPLLKRLEAIGYVTRERDPSDERALQVRLTRRGAAQRRRAEKVPPAIVDRLGMTVPELEEAREVLDRLIAAADPGRDGAGDRRAGDR